MIAFVCAVLSALAWGLAPIFGKLGLERSGVLECMAARTFVTLALVYGCLAASDGWARLRDLTPSTWSFIAAEALLATVAGDFAYYAAMKYGNASTAAPVLAASPVITLWFSSAFLKERVSALGILGTALIVFGVALVGIDSLRH